MFVHFSNAEILVVWSRKVRVWPSDVLIYFLFRHAAFWHRRVSLIGAYYWVCPYSGLINSVRAFMIRFSAVTFTQRSRYFCLWRVDEMNFQKKAKAKSHGKKFELNFCQQGGLNCLYWLFYFLYKDDNLILSSTLVFESVSQTSVAKACMGQMNRPHSRCRKYAQTVNISNHNFLNAQSQSQIFARLKKKN